MQVLAGKHFDILIFAFFLLNSAETHFAKLCSKGKQLSEALRNHYVLHARRDIYRPISLFIHPLWRSAAAYKLLQWKGIYPSAEEAENALRTERV